MARTTGRIARGNHGSLAMLGVWLIGVLFAGTVLAFTLAARTPAWFRNGIEQGEAARQLAQRLENRLITEAYRFRGEPSEGPGGVRVTGTPWKVRISSEEATAWAATKLEPWLANREPPVRLPANCADLQTHFGSGRAWVAANLDRRVCSLSAGVLVNERGVSLHRVRVGVGSLWLPVGWRGMLGLDASEIMGATGKILTGQQPLLPGGTFRLEDGRQVRVLEAQIVPGAIEVECRTEVR